MNSVTQNLVYIRFKSNIDYLYFNALGSSSLLIKLKLQVFNYIGKYSNVIEKTRAAEIALSIKQQKDLGCQTAQIITINEDKSTCTRNQVEKFWHYLGVHDIGKLNGIFSLFFLHTVQYMLLSCIVC